MWFQADSANTKGSMHAQAKAQGHPSPGGEAGARAQDVADSHPGVVPDSGVKAVHNQVLKTLVKVGQMAIWGGFRGREGKGLRPERCLFTAACGEKRQGRK